MYKIFYNPRTLKIMGSSDGDDSMSFPHVKTKTYYHALENLEVQIKKGKPELVVAKGHLTQEDIDKLK